MKFIVALLSAIVVGVIVYACVHHEIKEKVSTIDYQAYQRRNILDELR